MKETYNIFKWFQFQVDCFLFFLLEMRLSFDEISLRKTYVIAQYVDTSIDDKNGIN